LLINYIVFNNSYKIKANNYKTHEVAELLKLKENGEKYVKYILANHINKFASYFCNSDKAKIQELDYLETIPNPKAKKFVSTFYSYIEKQTRIFLNKMDKGEIEVIFYFINIWLLHRFYGRSRYLSQEVQG
jgi:hypothetical protein